MAGHRFVDRVVDHFEDEVVEAAGGGVADVHARPLADVLEIGEMLEVLGGIRSGIAFERERRGVDFGNLFGFVGHGGFGCLAVGSAEQAPPLIDGADAEAEVADLRVGESAAEFGQDVLFVEGKFLHDG